MQRGFAPTLLRFSNDAFPTGLLGAPPGVNLRSVCVHKRRKIKVSISMSKLILQTKLKFLIALMRFKIKSN